MFKISKAINTKPKVFIVMGRSGCGKGTQVKLLQEYLEKEYKGQKIIHVETGSLLREFKEGKSLTQELTKQVVETGGLMPEAVVVGLWSQYLFYKFNGSENIIFDGCPRKLAETIMLDSLLRFYKIEKPNVIYVNVTAKWATERLRARQRKDDTEDGIKSRMNWFEKDVVPSINYFRASSYFNFVDVNGEQSIEDVHKEIMEKAKLD